MKISIIIPIYNGEAYLEECLESVLQQDIEDKEIICVDDGSTDHTLEIIKKYQNRYPYIKLIQQSNMGAAIARNKALDAAKGKYIAFMDADDFYIDKGGLRKMVGECEHYQMPICGSFRVMLTKKGREPADTYRAEVTENKSKILRFVDTQFDYYYQSYVYEREFLNRNELRFPNLRRYQDPPFFVRTMWAAKEFLVLPIDLYCYRTRSGVIIQYSFLQINDILTGIKYNIQFAVENKLDIVYENSIERLDKVFYDRIGDSIKAGNVKAVKILVEIQEIIDRNDKFDKSELLLLKNIKEELKEPLSCYQNYKIPFDKVPYGSNVIIYGAGVVGKNIYFMLKKTGYCNIVKWVDRNYVQYQKQGLNVVSPTEIGESTADYIIVSVERQDFYDEIEQIIKCEGWAENRIIVGPIEKLLEETWKENNGKGCNMGNWRGL